MNKERGKTPRFVVTILKGFVASALVVWLVTDDKLDFSALAMLWNSPRILIATVTFWIVGAVTICAFRWRALVMGMNFTLSRPQSIRLNLIGLFFNTIMPGAVGGDLVKAIYVCQGQKKSAKMPVLLTIILDRIIGLAALLSISLGAILINWRAVSDHGTLQPFIAMIFLMTLALAFFAAFVLIPTSSKTRLPFLSTIYQLIFKIGFLKNIYSALRSYKDRPQFMVKALIFAVIHQLLYMSLFVLVTNTFANTNVDLGLLATVLPLGIVTTAIPLAPGGLGIGHMAFEKLFSMIGLEDGANIFNLIFFGLVFLNLLGFIPYLFMKNELEPQLLPESS